MQRWYETGTTVGLIEAAFTDSRAAFESWAALDAPHLPDDPIDAMQVALTRWQVDRFGPGSATDVHMALGVIEELGESFDAESFDDALDGLGDVCVYAGQLATANRLAIGPIIALARLLQGTNEQPIRAAGQLAHVVLKRAQRIRGMDDEARYRRGIVACLALAIAKATDDIEVGHGLANLINVGEVYRAVGTEVMKRKKGDAMIPQLEEPRVHVTRIEVTGDDPDRFISKLGEIAEREVAAANAALAKQRETLYRGRLHVGDCPMTNSEPADRTSCVCEHHDDVPRDHVEGGGGKTVAIVGLDELPGPSDVQRFATRCRMGVKAIVLEALGAASMCWENVDGAGTFQADRCAAIAEELIADLEGLR